MFGNMNIPVQKFDKQLLSKLEWYYESKENI